MESNIIAPSTTTSIAMTVGPTVAEIEPKKITMVQVIIFVITVTYNRSHTTAMIVTYSAAINSYVQ
eukprot:scaffold320248_cov20-Prasinocladus_malaysianus.AAC.1